MKFLALCYFVLSLFGCDVGRSTFVNRISIDGVDALYSRATVEAGVARFECLRSSSGRCHYSVFPPACAASSIAGDDDGDCATAPVKRFALAKGDSRQLTGLSHFRLCVSADGAPLAPDCERPAPIAAR